MSISQMDRRGATFCNYLSVVIILILFYSIKLTNLPRIYILLEIVPFSILIFTFRIAFGTSNLWKLTHTSFSKLDEREIQLIYKVTTYSYSIFTIFCISLIYIFNLAGFGSIDALSAACLLYIAHILPASIIAWNEKRI